MKRFAFMTGMGISGVLLTALLSGCGGGQDGAPPTAQTPPALKVDKVDGRVQPASVDQGVPSLKSHRAAPVTTPSPIHLGALAQEKAKSASPGVGPRQVGQVRTVNTARTGAQTLQQLDWRPVPGGGQVAALSFSAEGAHGLRLGIVARQLPGNAVLRLYRQDAPATVFQISGQEVLQRIEKNALAGDVSLDGQTWWTPDLGADEVTLELELPAGIAVTALDVAIPRVSHIFENLALPISEDAFETKINNSQESCQVDASCHDNYADQRNAVARMSYVTEGNTYLCTGTLLNDNQSSGTPYFLTANHCVSSQAVADTLATDWFYRSPTCQSRTLSSNTVRRLGGATLLYHSVDTDTTLLRLNDAPPAGAFFAGWDASPQTMRSEVVGLHHPAGDLLKISFGALKQQTACTSLSNTSNFDCSGDTGNFYEMTWRQGMTESGSSGSALFNSANKVIGNLLGGSSRCLRPFPGAWGGGGGSVRGSEFYGRFDVAYEAGLKNWLAAALPAAPRRVAVYRFYNSKTAAHFFTVNVAERDSVINNLPDFAYEGIAFYAQTQAQGNIPVYRFYNTVSRTHFFTASAQERDNVRTNLTQFNYEGIAWYASINQVPGTAAVYRFYEPTKKVHFYTSNQTERDFIIANNPGYTYEGISYYAWTSS